MPDQLPIVKYREQRFVHPTPRPLPTSPIIHNLEARAEQEASGGSSAETQRQPEAQSDEALERSDSVLSPPTADSPDSEIFASPLGTELRVALQSSEHTPNHFYSLSLLEAGLRRETSCRELSWRRFFC
jgi:hypothetical protein